VQTAQIPLRKRALGVVVNLWLNLLVLLGSSCTGIQTDMGTGLLAVTSISNYEHLCALVVQDLADTLTPYQQKFHKEFYEQLARHSKESWYETGLP